MQLDLRNEAYNLKQFNENFVNWENIGFPVPFLPLCIKNVLIESHIDAIPLTKFINSGKTAFDAQISELGLRSFLKMLILDNMMHADLHAGNILVSFYNPKNNLFINSSKLKAIKAAEAGLFTREVDSLKDDGLIPFVYFIDTGLTSSLSDIHMTNFIELFSAITRFDGKLVGHLLQNRSKDPRTVRDPRKFQETMAAFINNIKKEAFSLQMISVSNILSFVFESVREHHVKLDSDFVNIAVGLLLVEGIGKHLNPQTDLLKASVPFLKEAVSKRIDGDASMTGKSIYNIMISWCKSKLV